MTISEAITKCKASGLRDWELVEYALKLASSYMAYSYTNSFDRPEKAFEKGRGYCWQQAGALNLIYKGLGINSRLVYAAKNRFPDKEYEGVLIKSFISGHVWCRVTIDGVSKYVCPGSIHNSPGLLHFQPLTKVHKWNIAISALSYLGSAVLNKKRYKKIMLLKRKQEARSDPAKCSCTKNKCERHGRCPECRAYHSQKKVSPHCER
ncbi:MAG: transglutaminase domain-containing protein [Papillibacter sp.]|jgi:hypothetical protein|nr:transglutaminase domain-containing protein [Papillibacter sp.]